MRKMKRQPLDARGLPLNVPEKQLIVDERDYKVVKS